MVTLILTALHAFKNVEVILVITGGGPGSETETMALRVFQEGFNSFGWASLRQERSSSSS